MKYIVWIKEYGLWVEQGDGALTLKQAERIAREIRRDCRCPAIVKPLGINPNQQRKE
jgi:hypothetical protein